MQTLEASKTPVYDIGKIAYEGQPANMRQYKHGYERWFEQLPLIHGRENNEALAYKVQRSNDVLQRLAESLKGIYWLRDNHPGPGEFDRTILGLETPLRLPPQLAGKEYREGAEIVVARWGDGFASPVHGHAAGLLHEQLISGKMRVNTYRRYTNGVARIVETKIVTPGTIASMYTKQSLDPAMANERHALIHNFVSIGQSQSLHFVPEHTRDGRDNYYAVEWFQDEYDLTGKVERITSQQGLRLQVGDVALVRSTNVPDYGDHFIIITGHPVIKEHGLRPQDLAASDGARKTILDQYQPQHGLTLLKLNPEAAEAYREFHGIQIIDRKVILPNV